VGQHLNFNLIRYGTWSRVDSCHHLHYALELATALTREEARHITDEILRSDATRQLSYDGLKALTGPAATPSCQEPGSQIHRIKLASWNGLVIRMIRPWIVRFGRVKCPNP
jgi:hypothetical protein